MKYRRILKLLFGPLVFVAAAIYFVIDALVLSILSPLFRRLAHLAIFQTIAGHLASLGPYATLAIFLIPLIMLEPVKPVGVYLMASGHFYFGVVVLGIGEVLKILIVERIFHIGRPKLMRIKAFAWTYNFVLNWLNWMKSLPPWLAVKRGVADFIRWMRKLKRGVQVA
jgi:hypothetical protein